jgi:hypothetical protein
MYACLKENAIPYGGDVTVYNVYSGKNSREKTFIDQ